MACIWLGIKFLRGLKMTSLSDNGEEKKKKHKTTVAYKKLEMWPTTEYFT